MLAVLAPLGLMAGPVAAESIVIGGIEDHAGPTPTEGIGDFNDLIFSLLGNVSVLAPSTEELALNSSVVDQSGNVFWDNQSQDGNDTNFGYCVLGGVACNADTSDLSLNYVATTSGAAITSELFQAIGPITATLLVADTNNAMNNTLGWYDPSNPGVFHQIFAGSGVGTVVTFTPSSIFALYSSNGVGGFYSSVASGNFGDSITNQHFALAEGIVPEPATGPLAAAVLVLAYVGRVLRRRAVRARVEKTA